MKKNLTLILLVSVFISVLSPSPSVQAADSGSSNRIHPFDYPQTDNYPEEINAVIEVPQGSLIKYEIDAETGYVIADRYQSMSVQYPGNYGSIPQTIGGDGDPLDVLVLTREPLVPGTVVKVRAIGMMKMIDDGEQDDKVIAVPVSDVDPTYDNVQDISDLPKIQAEQIEMFFKVYKLLPSNRKVVETSGFADKATAEVEINQALQRYKD
ncbi:inorganic diphosphatase [Paenibacillus terreus]|uniref:Inorganic pyrophosphatase n=1 Tax=Paenibacillus terreus TaxID=1387834 RepID=A0ABV5B5G0_9BACL